MTDDKKPEPPYAVAMGIPPGETDVGPCHYCKAAVVVRRAMVDEFRRQGLEVRVAHASCHVQQMAREMAAAIRGERNE